MSYRTQTDSEILAELGLRVRRARLRANVAQREVAREAGISERTLRALEKGDDVQLTTLFRVLRVLGRLDGLEALLPDPKVSPMEALRARRAGRERKAAGRSRGAGG